jgi:hypothetical protein
VNASSPFCFLDAGPLFLTFAGNTHNKLCWEQYEHGAVPLHFPLLFLHVSHAEEFLTRFSLSSLSLSMVVFGMRSENFTTSFSKKNVPEYTL